MRNVTLALLASSLLSAGAALGQTVTDVGEVVIDENGNLSIGLDGFGSRNVDAADDGPYTSVTVGLNAGSSGELTMFNSATLRTSGPLSVGNDGGGRVEVRGGSQLFADSVSARRDRGDAAEIVVSGVNSRLVSAGALALSGVADSYLRILDGGSVKSGSGGFRLGGNAVVSGLGSTWEMDSLSGARGRSSLTIMDGGSVAVAGGYRILEDNGALTLSVDGPGSRLSVGGTFSARDGGFGSISTVSGGGHVSTANIMTDDDRILVTGEGSSWVNSEDIEVLGLHGIARWSVVDGGQISTRNTFFSCQRVGSSPGCSVTVSGSGSLWRNLESFELRGEETVFALSDLGVLDVGGVSLIAGTSELALDSGVVLAESLHLDGSSVTGQGLIQGQVANSGTVDPGDTVAQTTGTLSIEGTYSQDATASLEILLTGSDVHTFDKVTVTGTVELAGELAISVGDGFATELGDQFLILEYESRTGEFDQITGLQLAEGLSLRPVYGAQTMYLETVPEPSTALMVGCGLVALSARRRLLA